MNWERKSNLGVKILHMPSVSESWALGSGLHLVPQTVIKAHCELDHQGPKDE